MRPLRHFLLVAVLLLGQLLAGAHAVAHVGSDGDGLTPHTCQFCLAAHDLGTALPTTLALPLPPAAALAVASFLPGGRPNQPAPRPSQRGPPQA